MPPRTVKMPRASVDVRRGPARLEAIVAALEEGQVPLAESLARYEEGIKLLKQCYQSLTRPSGGSNC